MTTVRKCLSGVHVVRRRNWQHQTAVISYARFVVVRGIGPGVLA